MMSKEALVRKATKKSVGMLLDVGSGTGTFVHTMVKAGWNVSGLEPDADARAIGVKKYNCDIYPSEELFRLPEGTYDAITMWHVLEHVHDLQGYMAKLKTLLKGKGRLIIAVPNYTSGDAATYGEYWAAYDVPRHLYHFSPASMKGLVEKHGLRLLQYKPMWYDSFYVSLLSSKYKNGATGLVSAFINGLRSNIGAWKDVKKCSSVIYIIGH
jgi:2-polyprenyl-3-methyl-5-hydroxy-6-metoxy-1,4-benzoquinol methylase